MQSNFKNRLIEAMKIRDVSQAELARKTGLSKPRISQYVNGTYEAKQQALFALAEALDVNISWLMGNDVPMESNYNELRKEVDALESIQKAYGKEASEVIHLYLELDLEDRQNLVKALEMYTKLDENDQGEIRGEMKQMLKADKYRKKRILHRHGNVIFGDFGSR